LLKEDNIHSKLQ